MVDAFVLIRAQAGKGATVREEVSQIRGIRSADMVTGPYDVIARAEARSIDELGRSILVKIQAVEGVTRTLTCPVLHR